ncbi:tyrosine-protein phosphatase [Utexia brackfieldae]|uniref:tyrosine-protein phosphatase n=1 Tax=Utexia brackfieldae TaxID=3074108 RepID=UPI00370DA977
MMQNLSLTHAINFRELGGIKTQDNAVIKHGVLFRSGALSDLSKQDLNILTHDIQLTSVLDYRDKSEIDQNPDTLWPGAQYFSVPANPIDDDITANLMQEVQYNKSHQGTGHQFMITLYERLPFHNAGYFQLVDLLKESTLKPMVQHCAIGKDRTGVGSALTLFALGVDEDTVMADYLLTEQTLAPFRAKILSQLKQHKAFEDTQFQQDIFAAKTDYLHAALKAIKKQYSSVDKWLAQEYGLNKPQREQLERKYLF